MNLMDLFELIVLIGFLSFGLWLLWLNIPTEDIQYKMSETNFSGASKIFANTTQFYPRMRYIDNEISYWISPECSVSKKQSIFSALSILTNRTILSFYNGNESSEIRYLCSGIKEKYEKEEYFVAGEGGPIRIINTSSYYIIYQGEVSLYRNERCKTPQIALHETLHALGFDHNDNPKSIMFPVTDCNQILDEYIVDEINRIYSTKPFADLIIENVNANKSGKYLNFEASVSNIGLKDAQNVELAVYSGEELLREFDLENINIGVKRTIGVENIVIGNRGDELTFIVRLKKDREISILNNKIDLVVV